MVRAQTSVPRVASNPGDASGSLPYAIDHFSGQPQLVRVHQSAVEHKANANTNAIGELRGAHARTVLHDSMPSFYVHPAAVPNAPPTAVTFAIVRAFTAKDLRVFAQVEPDDEVGKAKHIVGFIQSTTQDLQDGWVKITPKTPLAPGEYALNPIPRSQNQPSPVVFDFSIDPAAPNTSDVVAPPDPTQSSQ
jgi:hypothetical protein